MHRESHTCLTAIGAYCGSMNGQERRQGPGGTLSNESGTCLTAAGPYALGTETWDGSADQRRSRV